MLPIQRRQAIHDYLSQHGSGSIRELSQAFDVSEMTVRRDLELLEHEGNVSRSHGGAIYMGHLLSEPELAEKQLHPPDLKHKLASYAVERFIEDGDVIILEGGTAVSQMVNALKPLPFQLTILTNGLSILNELQSMADKHTLLSCGGLLRERSGTFVGPVAEAFFEQYNATTAFLSALSFTVETGFTDPDLMDTQVKKAMIRSAARTVMLLDSSQIGTRSLATIVKLEHVAALVTDEGVPKQVRVACEASGTELHIV